MPALLSWVNWLDRAATVITASSQAGSLGPTRLAEPQLRARWRSAPGVVTPQLDVDFGASREVGILALAQPDDAGGVDADGEARGWMASTDTVRHRLDVTTAGAGAVLDTTAIAGGWRSGYGIHVHQPGAPVTARYWRCNLNAASLASVPGFVDLGRAWAGPVWTPSRGNIAYGFGEAWADGAEVTRNARSGLDFVDLGPRQRVVSFGFPVLTEADGAQIRELQRIAGVNGQVLFVPFPGAGAEKAAPLIGRLTEVQPITLPSFARYAATFQIRQSI
jgi:hypothetical protein